MSPPLYRVLISYMHRRSYARQLTVVCCYSETLNSISEDVPVTAAAEVEDDDDTQLVMLFCNCVAVLDEQRRATTIHSS